MSEVYFIFMEKFCLNWNDFKQNASNAFNQLRNDNDLIDVTLVSDEGEHIRAHKVVLSTSSDFFKDALKKANHTNPLIFLSGFNAKVLIDVLDYMYNGEVNLYQEEIDVFLQSAQKLKIKGLTQKLQEENTFTENEENKSIFASGSYLKKEEDSHNVASEKESQHVRESTFSQKETTVASIDSHNVRHASNYDEYITKCEVGWNCNFCGVTKTTKTNINLHVEVHIDGLSFPCKFCSMSFRSRNILNLHKNRVHK